MRRGSRWKGATISPLPAHPSRFLPPGGPTQGCPSPGAPLFPAARAGALLQGPRARRRSPRGSGVPAHRRPRPMRAPPACAGPARRGRPPRGRPCDSGPASGPATRRSPGRPLREGPGRLLEAQKVCRVGVGGGSRGPPPRMTASSRPTPHQEGGTALELVSGPSVVGPATSFPSDVLQNSRLLRVPLKAPL